MIDDKACHHKPIAGIEYRNIGTKFGLETPGVRVWNTSNGDDKRAKILIRTEKQVMVKQPDIVVVKNVDKKTLVVDVATSGCVQHNLCFIGSCELFFSFCVFNCTAP